MGSTGYAFAHHNLDAYRVALEMAQLAKQLSGQNSIEVVPYAAESGQFQQAGFSVAMCGPGSIDQAHQPDEFISIAQLERGTDFMRRLIELQSA